MLEGITHERIIKMTKRELRWFDNIKKAFYESDIALSKNQSKDICIEKMCKAIDTAKTLRSSLRDEIKPQANNKKKYIAFLDSDIPNEQNGGLCIELKNTNNGQVQEFSYSKLVYDIRCAMIHENDSLNTSENIEYHIQLDWSKQKNRTMGIISNGRITLNGYSILYRLRETLAKFITIIDSSFSFERDGSFHSTVCPELGSIKPTNDTTRRF